MSGEEIIDDVSQLSDPFLRKLASLHKTTKEKMAEQVQGFLSGKEGEITKADLYRELTAGFGTEKSHISGKPLGELTQGGRWASKGRR